MQQFNLKEALLDQAQHGVTSFCCKLQEGLQLAQQLCDFTTMQPATSRGTVSRQCSCPA